MKKVLMSMFFAAAVFSATSSKAQVSVNINLGTQPQWGPAGYDYAEYYYMPDIETYYYVPRKEFVYLSGDRWMFSPNLPPRYSGYDLYSGHKVVFTTPNAYKSFKTHKVRYAKYKNHKGQMTLKSKGNHYGHYKNKGKSGKGNSNGGGYGKAKGKGKH